MKVHKENHNKILSKIGLSAQMTKGLSSYIYDETKFTQYVSSEYRSSQRKETDEVYNMYEIVLLHKTTGLRITYTTTESYDGETVEYMMINIFVKTSAVSSLQVLDVDFDGKLVFTEAETIAFDAIDNRGFD